MIRLSVVWLRKGTFRRQSLSNRLATAARADGNEELDRLLSKRRRPSFTSGSRNSDHGGAGDDDKNDDSDDISITEGSTTRRVQLRRLLKNVILATSVGRQSYKQNASFSLQGIVGESAPWQSLPKYIPTQFNSSGQYSCTWLPLFMAELRAELQRSFEDVTREGTPSSIPSCSSLAMTRIRTVYDCKVTEVNMNKNPHKAENEADTLIVNVQTPSMDSFSASSFRPFQAGDIVALSLQVLPQHLVEPQGSCVTPETKLIFNVPIDVIGMIRKAKANSVEVEIRNDLDVAAILQKQVLAANEANSTTNANRSAESLDDSPPPEEVPVSLSTSKLEYNGPVIYLSKKRRGSSRTTNTGVQLHQLERFHAPLSITLAIRDITWKEPFRALLCGTNRMHESVTATTTCFRDTECVIPQIAKIGQQMVPPMKLNPVQQKAVDHALAGLITCSLFDPQMTQKNGGDANDSNAPPHNCERYLAQNPFVLIEGCPGSGKSQTILAIIAGFLSYASLEGPTESLSREREFFSFPRRSVLVCAPSNAAIDEILRRLLRTKITFPNGEVRSINVVRLGVRTSVDSTILDMRKDVYVGDLLDAGISRKKAIADADVVLSTLGAIQRIPDSNAGRTSNGGGFSLVIIDEAGQATEPECLVPLCYYACKRCVLIGDSKQLRPTVFERRAADAGYSRSLLERLLEAGHGSHLLNIQYRMRPEISTFPNLEFYQGKLVDAGPGSLHAASSALAHPTAFATKLGWKVPEYMVQKPFIFFHLSNSRDQNSGSSLKNVPEVDAICDLFEALCGSLKSMPNSKGKSVSVDSRFGSVDHHHNLTFPTIGIITFYRAQVNELRQAFTRKKLLRTSKSLLTDDEDGRIMLDKESISTVDSFQGQERDIIILSCVRSNMRNDSIGFLEDRNRLNVALTRAKHHCIVFGNAEYLSRTDQTFESLVKGAHSRNALINFELMFDDVFSPWSKR